MQQEQELDLEYLWTKIQMMQQQEKEQDISYLIIQDLVRVNLMKHLKQTMNLALQQGKNHIVTCFGIKFIRLKTIFQNYRKTARKPIGNIQVLS